MASGSALLPLGSTARRPNVQGGFTLVEVIVSAVVMLVASVGAIVAFNVITQSVRGTGLRADQSRRIDAQIAEISRLAEVYTSCSTPAGAVPPTPVAPATACSGSLTNVAVGNSFFYFPDPANAANVQAFFDACRSTTAATHITANFITAVDLVAAPGGGITRQAATRVPDPDNVVRPHNHTIQLTWTGPGNRVLRRFRVTPLVSAWCP